MTKRIVMDKLEVDYDQLTELVVEQLRFPKSRQEIQNVITSYAVYLPMSHVNQIAREFGVKPHRENKVALLQRIAVKAGEVI